MLRPINIARTIAVAVALAGAASGSALAACSPGAASPQRVADFMANPPSVLGGTSSEVSSAIRDLVASDPATLPAVIGLLKGASSDMQKAIGTGLGLAAGICIRPDPTFAAEIQTQLAASDSQDAKTQYAAVTGNQLIGAAGGGGGGGGAVSGGASGGQVNTLPTFGGSTGTTPGFAANSVSNSPTGYFSGSTSGISRASSTTTSVSSSTP